MRPNECNIDPWWWNPNVENIDFVYSGKMLDAESSRILEKCIKDWFKKNSALASGGPQAISRYQDRYSFISETTAKLDQYWMSNVSSSIKPNYSAQIVAETLDYYLPKAYLSEKRKNQGKRGISMRKLTINRNFSLFKNWYFWWEETKDKLDREREERWGNSD